MELRIREEDLFKEKKKRARSTRLIDKCNLQYTETNRRLRQGKRAYCDELSTEAERAANCGEQGEVYKITELTGRAGRQRMYVPALYS